MKGKSRAVPKEAKAYLVGKYHFVAAVDEAEAASFALSEMHLNFDTIEEASLEEEVFDESTQETYTFKAIIEANRDMVPFLIAVKDSIDVD